ncbi:extracellular serine-threonine rich protein [Plakobranchus ocellatus]|uniref:Extracellular serine-threonine rich protein n=1 Tax=Plakobranchus ocellatus TaxID=259542 RepID=A0AAV3Y9Q3_9GAST|nr:extracellular serine-threonine rich protein [Plakobranchus ocellatus]
MAKPNSNGITTLWNIRHDTRQRQKYSNFSELIYHEGKSLFQYSMGGFRQSKINCHHNFRIKYLISKTTISSPVIKDNHNLISNISINSPVIKHHHNLISNTTISSPVIKHHHSLISNTTISSPVIKHHHNLISNTTISSPVIKHHHNLISKTTISSPSSNVISYQYLTLNANFNSAVTNNITNIFYGINILVLVTVGIIN